MGHSGNQITQRVRFPPEFLEAVMAYVRAWDESERVLKQSLVPELGWQPGWNAFNLPAHPGMPRNYPLPLPTYDNGGR